MIFCSLLFDILYFFYIKVFTDKSTVHPPSLILLSTEVLVLGFLVKLIIDSNKKYETEIKVPSTIQP